MASMRPRVFPAEDETRPGSRRERRQASMRPRVFPAEDSRVSDTSLVECSRFNEAAGIPPRKTTSCGRASIAGRCFNEAAGIPRGRLH